MGQGVGKDWAVQAGVSAQVLCSDCRGQALCEDGVCAGLEEGLESLLVEGVGAHEGGSGSSGRRRWRRASPPLPPPPADAQRLLRGCPRELADSLWQLQQWGVLRCGPWLSDDAQRAFFRSLQRCHLSQLVERHVDATAPDDSVYVPPVPVGWQELLANPSFSAGQVFASETMPADMRKSLRKAGLQALHLGRVAVVLLAGGAGLRFGGSELPVSCSGRVLKLPSGKSILQLLCERVRRLKELAATEGKRKTAAQIPVFVMTSRLTHQMVVEHFRSNCFFGLPSHDVKFFEQPDYPVMHESGHLLPQSLGGQFARAPGGPGEVLRALAASPAMQELQDRGVQSLHIVGTDNLLAKVGDPVFIGFCQVADWIDCACKVTERLDPDEDMELFCVRRRSVQTHMADVEEAACGLDFAEASEAMRHDRGREDGRLLYSGSINSVFAALPYLREISGRRMREHQLSRPVPYLDFHLSPAVPDGELSRAASADSSDHRSSHRRPLPRRQRGGGPPATRTPWSWAAGRANPRRRASPGSWASRRRPRRPERAALGHRRTATRPGAAT
ncbi:unnamed protein product [Prorocentrum cordatum]|uniref:UDP-N-acetylglucosamine diphosphorylase n=1 Tax=Prorocentrum cordatum TaxID=2364126 RepID=A0ABN9RUD5_9DINO|nr:unnamed protein product [Polarella glacialis]CAK0822022.1 unnamed protein product [Polarella glacialis]